MSLAFIWELANKEKTDLLHQVTIVTLSSKGFISVFVNPPPFSNIKLFSIIKHRYQVILAVILVYFGVILIIIAFIVPPTGIIDPTILTAYGETLTFSGSLIGIDYHYKSKSCAQSV